MVRIPGIPLGTAMISRRSFMGECSGLITLKLRLGHEVFPDFAVQSSEKSVSPNQISFTLLHTRIYTKAENMPGKSCASS